MDNRSYAPMSLLTILPEGKVENDVRIADRAVTGVCTVYAKRSDSENEFLLREVGVALIDGSCNLTAAVRMAIDQAYSAAIGRIVGARPDCELQVTSFKLQGASESPGGVAATEPSRPPIDLTSVLNAPDSADVKPGAENASPISGDSTAESEAVGGIERIDFTEKPSPTPKTLDSGVIKVGMDDSDNIDPDYQNALDTVITIFGKLHDCNNWKAGKILNERPEVIVDFCHRNGDSYTGPKYTGPRTDQKDALLKLYPDALRKLDKAA